MIKKRYLFFIIILSLFVISAVSASDNINETQLTANNGDEVIGSANNNEILGVANGTYSELITEIDSGGDIVLSKDFYTYDFGDTISISKPGTINGNGAVIDMSGKSMRTLNINATDVTLLNITFKNMNVDDYDGSIHFEGSGTVKNCTFISNCARSGASLNFEGDAIVNDCIFINNTAQDGAAIYATSGIVNNCIFINNTGHNVISSGGAVYFSYAGTFKNCSFTNCTVEGMGGAVYCGGDSLIDSCNFVNNRASMGGALILSSGTVKNSNFTDNSVKLTQYGTYGHGGALFFAYESHSTKIVENCNFVHNTAVETGGAIYFHEDSSDCTFSIKGSNFINNRAKNVGAVQASKTIGIESCSFINNTASGAGGAIRLAGAENSLKDCIFINNTANDGGAIRFESSPSIFGSGSVVNCNFTNNSATQNGGAVTSIDFITADNCNFINNTASRGSAVFVGDTGRSNNVFKNSKFLDNRADSLLLNITKDGEKIRIVFKGKDNLLNAIYATRDVDFYNVVYWGADGISNTGNSLVTLTRCENEAGQNISIQAVFDDELIINTIEVTDVNGEISLDCPATGDYIIKASHKVDSYYTQIDNLTANVKFNVTMNIDAPEIFEGDDALVNVTILPNNATGSITIGNITRPVERGNASFVISGLHAGNITLPVFYSGDDIFNNASTSADIIVKPKRILTIDSNDISMAYGDDKSLIANLSYDGDYVEVPVAITVNGDVRENMTSTGGKITLDDLNTWGVGNYTVNLTVNTSKYRGNKTVKVTISKATPDFTIKDIALNVSENGTIVINNIKADSNPVFTNLSNNISIASVADGIVYGVGEGKTTITVTIMESENYTSLSKNLKVTVSKIATTINVDTPSVLLYIGQNQTAGASLYPDEAGELTYQSSDDAVAIVENGLIIAKCAGNATITVSFGGNYKYGEAKNKTIDVSVSLYEASVNVNNATLDLKVDDNFTIVATTTPEGLDVIFNSGDNSVVTVDSEGNVKAVGEGKTTITASIVGNGTYYENSTEIAVTVSRIPTKIQLENKSIILKAGENISIIAHLVPAEAGNLTYTSMDLSVVKVENGHIMAVSKGIGGVNVTFEGNYKYAPAKSQVITVIVQMSDASVSAEDLKLNVGDKGPINATTNPSGLKISYSSSDISVANVDDDGVVTAIAEGVAVITLKVGDDKAYAKNSTQISVTVSKIPTKIQLENKSVILKAGENISNIAHLIPAEAGNLTYASMDLSVVKVENGQIIAISRGIGGVNVTFAGDNNYAPAKSQVITVIVQLNDASVSAKDLELNVGDKNPINATTNPLGLKISYSSNNASVAIVDDDGVVTAVGEGVAVITLKVGDDKVYAKNSTQISVTVSKIPTEIILENTTIDMKVTDEAEPVVSLMPSNAGNLTFTSSDEDVVIVDADGKITAVGAGNATVTISFNGNKRYIASENKTISVTVRLNDASVSVNNDTLDLFIDDKFAITVTTVPEGLNVTFIPDDSGVVSVDENGVVTALKEGTASITVKVGGDGVYAENSTEVIITVSKIPTEITVGNATLDVKVLNITLINATLTPVGAGNLTYNSSNSSVAMVMDGVIIPVGKGTAIITVSFAGDDKYAASENKTITVNVSLNDASVRVDKDTLDLFVGDNFAINATTVPSFLKLLNITYISGDESVAVVDENGTVTAVGEGTAIIAVSVGDDKVFAKNSTTLTVNVKDKTIDVSAPDVEKYFGGPERFVVTVTDCEGNPLANKSVCIVLNGATYNRTTKSDGKASIAINLNSGNYNITATVDDITVKSSVTVKSTVNATDLVKVFRNGTQFYATFLDSEGNYLAEGTIVRFNINGVFYDREVKANGLAKLNINLEQGTYIITSMNLGTGENAANNVTVIPRIIENHDITKYYRNATQYTVKLIGDDGAPVGAGETVSFNINGVFYNRTTIESGIAQLNINLQPGDYIITAEYKGCRVSNNITVLPVLTAKDLTKKYGTPDQFVATLVDGQGKAYANQTVTFNINGVFYNRVTDSNGQARLNIRLMSGEYIITSSYNGANIANKITIKS